MRPEDVEDFDHTEREVIAHIDAARRQHALRPLMAGIVLLILLGVIATWASVRTASAASAQRAEAAVQAAATQERLVQITQQLKDAQERSASQSANERASAQLLLLAICDQIEAVAAQAKLNVPPCPRVATPLGSPTAHP